MLQMLGAGQRLAIFPEGTSTAGDKLLPFHAALFQSAIDAAVPVYALALSYHRADGTRSAAPAYIDDISLLECLMSVLQSGGLVARVSLAASFTPPLQDRRHLAHRAHQAIATELARVADFASMPPVRHIDPSNRGGNAPKEAAQSPRNEVAIMP
jgi:1-acyl-sn-glycerol-3-phosphate acyltransferase